MTDLDDSFFGSFLSSLERGDRDRSRRELRDDFSLLRLLLGAREEEMGTVLSDIMENLTFHGDTKEDMNTFHIITASENIYIYRQGDALTVLDLTKTEAQNAADLSFLSLSRSLSLSLSRSFSFSFSLSLSRLAS